MARPREKLDTHNQADQALELLEHEPAGIRRERLLAIKAALEDEKKISEIARDLGRSQQTVSTWMKWFREGGLAGLLERPGQGKGPESELPPRLRKELLKKVAKGSFRRAEDARRWLSSRNKARDYTLGATYKYLKDVRGELESAMPPKRKKS